jgi:hypothetical protein
MDPVSAGVLAAVLLGAVGVVGLAVLWWMVRKTLSMLKRMVMLVLWLMLLGVLVVGVVAAVVTMG